VRIDAPLTQVATGYNASFAAGITGSIARASGISATVSWPPTALHQPRVGACRGSTRLN
jgi:hypothetical protein